MFLQKLHELFLTKSSTVILIQLMNKFTNLHMESRQMNENVEITIRYNISFSNESRGLFPYLINTKPDMKCIKH